MNSTLKTGTSATELERHLDADQLSAFHEGKLPAAERLDALRHMAECAHCRDLIFLAQTADDSVLEERKETAPVVTSAGTTGPRLKPTSSLLQELARLWNPHRAWSALSAAALVCCTAGVLFFHIRSSSIPRASSKTNVAGLSSTSKPRIGPVAPPSSAERRAAPAEKVHKFAPAASPSLTEAQRAAPPSPKAAPPAIQSSVPAPDKPVEVPNASGLALAKRRSQALPPQIVAPALPGNAAALPSASSRDTGSRSQAEGNVLSQSTLAAPAPQGATRQPAASPKGTVSRQTVPAANATIEVNADSIAIATISNAASTSVLTLKPLPSKLAAVASVTSGSNLLVLDTAGTLFRSHDVGKHWKHVKPNWPGAVQSLQLTPDAQFQITTEHNSTWRSSDGHHWRPAPDRP